VLDRMEASASRFVRTVQIGVAPGTTADLTTGGR
jgi:hypothetical protein